MLGIKPQFGDVDLAQATPFWACWDFLKNQVFFFSLEFYKISENEKKNPVQFFSSVFRVLVHVWEQKKFK